MAKVIDKPTTIQRPIKTPDEYNDLVILQRIVVNANRIGDLESMRKWRGLGSTI